MPYSNCEVKVHRNRIFHRIVAGRGDLSNRAAWHRESELWSASQVWGDAAATGAEPSNYTLRYTTQNHQNRHSDKKRDDKDW